MTNSGVVRWNGWVWGIFLLILIIGTVLRIYRLDAESPWWDEFVSLEQLHAPSLTNFVHAERVSDPAMVPVYFAVEYYWSHLVGAGVYSVRLLSIILGLASIVVLFLFARDFWGDVTGICAASFLAFSMPHIYFSQEIRMYVLVVLLAIVSMWTFARAWWGKGNNGWLAAHLVSSLLLVFTHLFSVFLLAAQGIFLLLYHRRPFWRVAVWGIFHSLVMVGVLVWLSTANQTAITGVTNWIVKPGLREFGMLLLIFAGGRPSNENPVNHLPIPCSLDGILALVMGTLVLYATWVAAYRRDKGREFVMLALWGILPPMSLALISYSIRPSFVYRYVLYCSPAFYLLAGWALACMGKRNRMVIYCLLVVLFSYQLSARVMGPFRADWRTVSRYLETHVKPNDLVLAFQGINALALRYNSSLPDEQIECAEVWSAVAEPVVSAYKEGRGAWVAVWLWTEPANIERHLTAGGVPFTKRDFDGWPNVRLYHIEPDNG